VKEKIAKCEDQLSFGKLEIDFDQCDRVHIRESVRRHRYIEDIVDYEKDKIPYQIFLGPIVSL